MPAAKRTKADRLTTGLYIIAEAFGTDEPGFFVYEVAQVLEPNAVLVYVKLDVEGYEIDVLKVAQGDFTYFVDREQALLVVEKAHIEAQGPLLEPEVVAD